MGLNQHLQASTVAGIINKYRGASLYLSDRTSTAQATQTLVCRAISMTERLDLPTLLNHNVPAIDGPLPNATHVVVGVLYGAEIYCVLAQDIQDEDARQMAEKKLSKISTKMQSALENNQEVAEFIESLDKEDNMLISRVTCRLYADLQIQPVAECTVFEAYKNCLKLIEKIQMADASVPISVILCPIDSILEEKIMEYRDVDGGLVGRLCRIWNELERVGAKAVAIQAVSKKADGVSLGQFSESVVKFQGYLKCNWKEIVVKARRSEDGGVERAAHFAESHPLFRPSNLDRWMNYKKAEMELAGKMGSISEVALLASKSELGKKLADRKFSLVLTVPPLDERTNEILQVMKSYVQDFTLPVSEDEDELPWYLIRRKRQQVLDKMLELAGHVERNKHLVSRVQFLITFGDIGQRFGCKYSVYRSGKLIKGNLGRLPGPTTELRIQFAPDKSAVRILWDHEDFGWPCHFVVEYRSKDQLNGPWKQLKTGETQAVVRFEKGLEMRVAAETCVGLGDFSNVIDQDNLQLPNETVSMEGLESGPSKTTESKTLDGPPWYENYQLPIGLSSVAGEILECTDKV